MAFSQLTQSPLAVDVLRCQAQHRLHGHGRGPKEAAHRRSRSDHQDLGPVVRVDVAVHITCSRRRLCRSAAAVVFAGATSDDDRAAGRHVAAPLNDDAPQFGVRVHQFTHSQARLESLSHTEKGETRHVSTTIFGFCTLHRRARRYIGKLFNHWR